MTDGAGTNCQDQELVRRDNQRLRLFADALPQPVAYVDQDQCLQFNNRAYDQWFGSNQEEIKGSHVRDLFGAEAYGVLRSYLENALAGGNAKYEARWPGVDNYERRCQISCRADIDETDAVAGCFILVQDTTARTAIDPALAATNSEIDAKVKQRTAEIERVNAQLFAAIKNLPEQFALWDADDRMVFCNHVFRNMHAGIVNLAVAGTAFEDFIRASFAKVRPRANVAGREEILIQERLARHRVHDSVFEILYDDGRIDQEHERKMPDGGTATLGSDITALRNAEARLRECGTWGEGDRTTR